MTGATTPSEPPLLPPPSSIQTTRHKAKRTGSKADADLLPVSLDDYFVGANRARACGVISIGPVPPARWNGMIRIHTPTFARGVATRCSVNSRLTSRLQMDRWPREVRDAKVIQHAIGHVSKLNAIGRVLHSLARLEPEVPTPASERALMPAMTPTPGPASGERRGVVDIDTAEGLEGDDVRQLFSPKQAWRSW